MNRLLKSLCLAHRPVNCTIVKQIVFQNVLSSHYSLSRTPVNVSFLLLGVLAAWFIVVQILMTICCCIELVNIVIVILIWLRTSEKDKSGHGERRPSICRVRTAMIIAITTSE